MLLGTEIFPLSLKEKLISLQCVIYIALSSVVNDLGMT